MPVRHNLNPILLRSAIQPNETNHKLETTPATIKDESTIFLKRS